MKKKKRKPKKRTQIERLAGPALLLLVWIVGSATGAIPSRDLPGPKKVAHTGWELIENGKLIEALGHSMERVAIGLAIGVVAGVLLALIAALSRVGDDLIDAPMQMARTLPVLALVPLVVVWLGIGELPKVLLIAFASMFPIYVNLYAGIGGADGKLTEAAQTLRLSKLQQIRHVILPGALPSFLVGLRYATAVAWLVLVISEQVNANSGIGYMMVNAQQFLRTDIIVVGIIVYAILGLASDAAIRAIENRTLDWRTT